MRQVLGPAKPLIVATIVVLMSMTMIHALPPVDEPVPVVDRVMTHLEAEPGAGQGQATAASADAAPGSGQGTYHAIYGVDIRQGAPSTNYATGRVIRVGQDDGMMRGLLQFSLAALPPGAVVTRARLELFVTGSYDYPNTSRTITAYRVTSSWNEFLVKWNNAPAIAEARGSAKIPHAVGDWHAMDLTTLVRAWIEGTYPNYGVMLRGSESIAYREFASDGTTRPPRLVIDYALPEQGLDLESTSLGFIVGRTSGPQSIPLHRDTQTLAFSHATTDVLGWTATKVNDAPWLRLDRSSGLFSVVEPGLIHVSVMTDSLPGQGVYSEQIRIASSPAMAGSPQIANVTFRYQDGLQVGFLPLVSGYATTPDYEAVALFIGISDYIYLDSLTASTSSKPGQELKTNDALFVGSGIVNARGLSSDEVHSRPCALGPTTSASGSGFREENMMMLAEWRATKSAIREAFRWLDAREREDTLVLIAFGGHGGYMPDQAPLDEADGQDEYIIAAEYDSNTSPMAGLILDDELGQWLDELESQRVVVIVDSCFSGGMIDAQIEPSIPPERTGVLGRGTKRDTPLMVGDGLVQDISGPGRLVITASGETQSSWEFGDLEGGALTYFLIQSLLSAAADANGNGSISFQEAYRFAAARADSYVYPRTGYHQNPQLADGIGQEVEWRTPCTCP